MDYYYFGVIGYALAASGFFSSNDQKTKLLLVLACLSNCLYFGFNEMYISASIVALTGLRIGMSMYTRHYLIGVFFLMTTIMTPLFVSSNDWISILPGITGTIAAFWMTGRSMRVMLIVGSSLWIINNALAGAWVGVIGESILVLAGVLGLIRTTLRIRGTQQSIAPL